MGLPADKVHALQLSFEGLLKLHKSDSERFWEILKGITTPREAELATIVVDNMTSALKGIENGVRQLQQASGGKAAAGG
jgi:hypothetical protein